MQSFSLNTNGKRCCVFLILFYLSAFAFGINTDSLRKVLAGTSADTSKIRASYELSSYYVTQNTDSALAYCRRAESFLSPGIDLRWKAYVNIAWASVYAYGIGDFIKAEPYANDGLKYALQSKDYKFIGHGYMLRGSMYGSRGDYGLALTCFLKAEKYYSEIRYTQGLSGIYNDMGIVYLSQMDTKKAMYYYRKSYEVTKVKHPSDEIALFQNISGVFYQEQKYDSALFYINRNIALSTKLDDKNAMSLCLAGKSMVLRKTGDYKGAIECAEKAVEITKQMGDKWMLSNAYNDLGQIYQLTGKYDKSLFFFEEALKINKQIGAGMDVGSAYSGMSETYRLMGNYRKAYEFYKIATDIRDSLAGERVKKNVQEIEAKYKTEKKERELDLLNKAKTQDSLRMEIQVKDKDLQIEKRRGQVKYLAAIAIILAAFGIWIVYALRNKHKANLIIQQQKKDVEFQKQLVDEKQKEIIDSINYAKRIQSTLLASKKFIDENIGKSFILFKPKDIVSGDFYWAASVFSAPMAIGTSFLAPEISNKQHSEAQLQNKGTGNQELLYIAVCDSTGHGVPGAFMSLLNIGFLSESIKERGIHSPDKVFNQVRQRLTESISSEGQRDGFDGMLLRLDKSARQVFYAAANNAPLLISGGAIKNLPYDKMHVGKGVSEEEFTLHSFSYSPGDMLYLFTDGYPDQFGGPKGKKFKYKQLEELVFKNHNEPIEAQHSRLAEAFESWRGNLEQVDDVCIIGIKL